MNPQVPLKINAKLAAGAKHAGLNRTGTNKVANVVLALVGLLWAMLAVAADLGELKAQGLVGERADGYLGLVQTDVAAEVNDLVGDVNSKRKAQYQRIAVAHKIALAEVEALAGKKTLAKTTPGQWVYIESWRQK